MYGSYEPPGMFPVSASDTQPFKQETNRDKGKGVDRSVDLGDKSLNRFAQGSHSRASAPSITIDEMDDDSDDEPLASQVLSALKGEGDQSGSTDATMMSEDSDNDDIYQSVRSDVVEDFMDVEDSSPHSDARDLAQSIDGMYRVLDLISERGSGGLVDKVIIAQDSLRAFINSVCPGTYVSMTKVNFTALDRFIVKPVGVYGSKGEIVRLLSSLGVVDEQIAKQLIANQRDSSVSMPSLRSGLYIVRTACEATPDQQLFLIYWPEDSTWDDSAPSSVRRNRVTFMRYLMKMCDQVIALISSEHAQSIVWNDQESEDAVMDPDGDHDESSRLFTFEVSKTNEQEEAVKSRQGFNATSKHITMPQPHQDTTVDVEQPKPELMHGETTQGFMTVAFQPGRLNAEPMGNQSITRVQLGSYLKSDALLICEGLNADALKLLIDNGIRDRFRQQCEQFRQRSTAISSNIKSSKESEERRMRGDLKRGEPFLVKVFHQALVDAIIEKFPTFTHESFPCSAQCGQDGPTALDSVMAGVAGTVSSTSAIDPSLHSTRNEPESNSGRNELDTLIALYPDIGEEFRRKAHSEKISSRHFKDSKERICIAWNVLRDYPDMPKETRDRSIDIILHEDMSHVRATVKFINKGNPPHEKPKGFVNALWGKVSTTVVSDLDTHIFGKTLKEADTNSISDAQFLVELEDVKPSHIMAKIAAETKTDVLEYFRSHVTKQTRALVHFALHIQTDQCLLQVQREAASREEEQLIELRREFIHEINDLSQTGQHSHTFVINSAEETRKNYQLTAQIYVNGRREYFQDPVFEFSVHLMQLMEHDQHSLKMDPTMIPSPKFTGRQAYSFNLPLGHSVARAQLLSGDKILLATTDRSGNLMVYLESLTALEGALKQGRGKRLNRDKIGDFILAFDESKRVLSVVAREKLLLHIFVHDNTRSFQGSGSAINLTQWYIEGVTIIHACFICGSEELLLVDSLAQARIYSLTTMQFRPATLNLIQIPKAVYSTPDGSCLIATHARGSDLMLTAYHWSTFGSTDGVPLEIPDLPSDQPLLLTSLIKRSIVHLVALDIDSNSCRSFALDITRKVTEFTFKEKGVRGGGTQSENVTAHNCLIDCHAEVWTRFPVLSAVQRETITSSSNRCPRTLVFITDRDHPMFSPHFHDLIFNFERTSKKPTGTILKSMVVSATTYGALSKTLFEGEKWSVSEFRAGEWLVDILCLIPIHIAVTRENRFIPLKDGVYSTELEKSLLGADVNRIVDHLSFGWYESLFQSYMAKKPVKVVSSMGEQSVGKSFALNHLVDTSFAGSAMRTTEGVWMSVTPTKDALVVALDFEGVHSIERSAQEDTLLVLFNTAISNLVLFRNNFALSRDITGLFQSFQSSSTVLDPASNPSLFQSTLVIIIKDVVESDKAEITREFALKFQQIVQDEQEANFISRLHAGQLNIIPWPVIESQEFYKLFPTLKRRLDKQKLTHNTAGEFLHVMKTLMAKLKANDWGAMSQSMASHRAQLLSAMLPNALAFGLQEVNPDPEPLKNLDDDIPIGTPDSSSEFSLAGGSQSSSREAALQVLSHAWGDYDSRHHMPEDLWIENLTAHIDSLVNSRIAHVRAWISSNVARFQSGQASIDELMRSFESTTVDLKSNLQLCKLKCGSCELLCIQSRLHDGQHNCQTSHACIRSCDFCATSGETKACSMLAGHPGNHICVVNAHLCGQVCKLFGRQGCLDECTKVIGHTEDDHLCAATVHACGQPCDLSKLRLGDGSTPPCRGTCGIPSDMDHDQHQCDARLCSFPCQLCKRLCANTEHLHGLEDDAIHLCGEEHSCSMQCTAEGICEIETAPQSIEATFTGRHETFQYTKYSQVAKRLRCVKPVPPGLVAHKGPHNHSLDKKVVHFCRAKCDHCGYFCTLPLGHPQQEHETRHGSMSSSRWAVDGPDDTGLEVEGRRFSSNDEGAPMMCNLVCQALGRHVHIDYCRAVDAAACRGSNEAQHISKRLLPNPERAKDFMTHNLFWRRAGFKDPYSREEQANFAKCDSMCSGPEHTAATGNTAQPSYCTLPLFHPPMDPNNAQVGLGYVSNDGHVFSCRNPVIMQQAFHVIFVADRSGSMSSGDRHPLPNTPASDRIVRRSNNRFGAVLSSLYSFWSARAAAVGGQQAARRDSYSVILFGSSVTNAFVNDFVSSPDQLLDAVLQYSCNGGTNFTAAVQQAQLVMEQHWSTERSVDLSINASKISNITLRTPVIIFLSDGECSIADQTVQDLCRSAVRLGKALSFHAVSFGPDRSSTTLRRMTQIAIDIQNNAPRDPLAPPAATVASSYTQALDTVQLAETFLGFAESLRKPRGSLIH
ncbi:hypothetical protein DEU56DRAFT_984883 [Suillus clintonianus]|uniref:uncharacterized protein n=1 Tax=Suillus clintonianus TaxID=1904413 RepID=UPI001B8807DB|nr:uncharacterized protein DEU56DRAFT_984883 [Suillus clintonianus]KAG2116835.1 hypothetical protein DEU56DRAFT_984883 [Suillus clintonianus]